MARSDSPISFPSPPPPLRPIHLDPYPQPSPSAACSPFQQQPQQSTYPTESSTTCPCPDCTMTSSRHCSFVAATSSSSSLSTATAAPSSSISLGHSTINMYPAACSPLLPASKDSVAISIPPPPHAEYGSSYDAHHYGSIPPSTSVNSTWSQTTMAHHYPHHHQQQQQQHHQQQQRSFPTAHPLSHHNHQHHGSYSDLSLSALPESDPSSGVASAMPATTSAAVPPALVINTSFLHQPPHPSSGSHQSSYPHPSSSATLSTGTSMTQQQPSHSAGAPVRSKIPAHHHHPTTLAQLADFAAHMVCYLLFGHQAGGGSPLSPMPISPRPSTNCHCSSCLQHQMDSPTAAEGMLPSPVSARSSHAYYDHTTNQKSPTSRTAMSGRPTHRRVYSESMDAIPPPTALFRKFCLDVLSATQLSRSVILLSLKYIDKLMFHLKISNKIVNTGEGAEYRFFTGALILANKFLDDNTFTNKTWAEITGMKMVDVNHLEMQFLNGIDFRLFTSPEEYQDWLTGLTKFANKHLPALSMVPSHSQPLPAHQHPHPAYQQQPAPLPSQQPSPHYQPQYQPHHHQPQLRTPISPVDWIQQRGGQSNHSHNSHHHGTGQEDTFEAKTYVVHSTPGSAAINRPSAYPEYPPQPYPLSVAAGHTNSGTVTNRSSHRLSSSHAYDANTSRHFAGKRSAYQAFDDPMEDATLSSSSSALSSQGPTHKRASLSLSAGMSLLDVNSQPHQHSQHSQPLRTLHERSSHGSLRRSYKAHSVLSSHPYHPHASVPSMESQVLSHQQHQQHHYPTQHTKPHVTGSSSRRSHMRTLSESSSFSQHDSRYQHEGYLAPPAHIPAPIDFAAPVSSINRNEQTSNNRSSWTSKPSTRPMSMHSVGDEVCIAVPSHQPHSHQQSQQQQQQHHGAPAYDISLPSAASHYLPQDNGCACDETGHHRQLPTAATPSSAAIVSQHPFYPTPPPFAPSDKHGHAAVTTASPMAMGEPIETRVAMPSSGPGAGVSGQQYSPHHHHHHHCHHSPNQFELDPRMWAPFDSLSLYAITSQAAKRVVAHSKVLSASASNLHMYYPTSLA